MGRIPPQTFSGLLSKAILDEWFKPPLPTLFLQPEIYYRLMSTFQAANAKISERYGYGTLCDCSVHAMLLQAVPVWSIGSAQIANLYRQGKIGEATLVFLEIFGVHGVTRPTPTL